jgi:prepilin-type N-terminal cleavage/methylation domain-containing protein/prepilin-type processing-associated H-X9-DG protein
MIYIHKLENALSSNLALHFAFVWQRNPILSRFNRGRLMTTNCMRRFTMPSLRGRSGGPSYALVLQDGGFTLLELLIVLIVIAILATIGYPAFIGALERAKATKDMSNLRQVGIATQLYMNDNNGALPGSPGSIPPVSWMSQLYPKYLQSWYVLISPLDNPLSPRVASDNNLNSALSYGIDFNVYQSQVAISADKITKPTVFIVFAPAQDSSSAVKFQGTANTTSPANLAASANVTVVGIGGGQAISSPGGTNPAPPPLHGTHSSRTKINALFADWHVENMPWTTFTSNTANPASDPDGDHRWNP